MRLIGVDCATKANEAGLAVGHIEGDKVVVEQAGRGRGDVPLAQGLGPEIVARLDGDVLLAFDAPLGWPTALSPALADHAVGDGVAVHPDLLFRRATDQFVEDVLGKRPLEVAANLIARTARAALDLLGELRSQAAINLAWEPGPVRGVMAIEVYPAATLLGRRLSEKGYKGSKAEHKEARRARLDSLADEVLLDESTRNEAIKSDHVFDAIVCLLAAADFVRGKATIPETGIPDAASKEGWIWFWDKRHPMVRPWTDDRGKSPEGATSGNTSSISSDPAF